MPSWRGLLLALAFLLFAFSLLYGETRSGYSRLAERLGWRLTVALGDPDAFEQAPNLPIDEDGIRRLIRLTSLDQVEETRGRLIRFIWNTSRLSVDARPSAVEEDIHDPLFDDHPDLARIDRITTRLPFGFVSKAYHFHPRDGGQRLAIYHQGHDGSFRTLGRQAIDALLTSGFSVMAFDMPMRGLNTWPRSVELPGIGPVWFNGGSHWSLAILESDDFSPLRLFLDPVLRALNHAQARYRYDEVIMVGISGGGWATTVFAAVDPRVRRSYPIAGSAPFFLRAPHPRTARGNDGDYEQRVAAFYRIANYLELYVLGALGEGRRQVQILNKYDPCCFLGAWGEAYAPIVAQAVDSLGVGGGYRLVVDDGHIEHKISDYAIDLILGDMTPVTDLEVSIPTGARGRR